MTLGPAFMALLGEKMCCLPRSLDSALPNLDTEGEALARHTERVEEDRERELESPAADRAGSAVSWHGP